MNTMLKAKWQRNGQNEAKKIIIDLSNYLREREPKFGF